MKPIELKSVQQSLNTFLDKDIYIHLETTNGAYASHFNESINVGVFIRNANVFCSQGKIVKDGAHYRVGLKTDNGWIYAEGLTHWEMHQDRQLLMAGHDADGRLLVALQLSETPFK
ncbi:MAG TPA: YojF family protein [Cerasibacillus sp.]|uniref:YojF family protein n=1 Tax=Cerasibacillus sp. TaxID=2498711 RepID=UPI002F4271F1